MLTSIIGTTDYKTAFEGVDIALLIGAKPRGPGMQRKDLLTAVRTTHNEAEEIAKRFGEMSCSPAADMMMFSAAALSRTVPSSPARAKRWTNTQAAA